MKRSRNSKLEHFERLWRMGAPVRADRFGKIYERASVEAFLHVARPGEVVLKLYNHGEPVRRLPGVILSRAHFNEIAACSLGEQQRRAMALFDCDIPNTRPPVKPPRFPDPLPPLRPERPLKLTSFDVRKRQQLGLFDR